MAKAKKLNKTQRYVAGEFMGEVGLRMVNMENYLWRIAHRHHDGLTDGERELILKWLEDVKLQREKYAKMRSRLTRSSGKWWGDGEAPYRP